MISSHGGLGFSLELAQIKQFTIQPANHGFKKALDKYPELRSLSGTKDTTQIRSVRKRSLLS